MKLPMMSGQILRLCRRAHHYSISTAGRTFSQKHSLNITAGNVDSPSNLSLTTLSENEIIMKETVSKLAKEQIGPYVREMEKDGIFKRSVIDMLFQSGLLGIEVEEEYGGTGSNFMTAIIAVEEISKVDPSVASLVHIQNILINAILRKLGTPQQKEEYLTRLAKDTVGSFALTETTSGSDAFSMKTIAKRDGSDYVINGSKMWILNLDYAGVFVLMANANPSAGYKGITCFLVDRSLPGVTVGKQEKNLGLCANGTCIVTFENVRVPGSAMLGELGQGYKYITDLLNESRIGVGAQQLGLAQGCFDATIPYTLDRKQFGQAIFDFQSMQHQIARISTQIECSRLLVYNAARLAELNQPFGKQAAMAKYFSAEVSQESCIKCIDWMGGLGFSKDSIQEKFYRDCKAGSIYDGTTNMLLSTIAMYIKKEYTS